MKPIRTPDTQFDYKGPTPDIGDLPCHRVRPGFILSEWDLTKAERIAIARGGRIELGIHTEPIPPVQLNVVQRDAEGALSYVDEHGPWEAITPEELAGPRLPFKGHRIGRLIVTTCRNGSGAPIIDDAWINDQEGNRYHGKAILLTPWRKDSHGERKPQRALAIGWRIK